MLKIRKHADIAAQALDECHEGEGVLKCSSLLDGFEPTGFALMHSDEIPAGVTIGVHEHVKNEEVYYLLSGKGILTFDGEEYEMEAGDISLCKPGHSHGFAAAADSVLIVAACKK